VPSEEEAEFIRAHHDSGTDILTVCTGIFPAGYAGVVEGKSVTGPRALVPELRKRFPGGKWTEKRWVRDDGGRVWSSGTVLFSFFTSDIPFIPCIVCEEAACSGFMLMLNCRRHHQRPGHGCRVHPREVQSRAVGSGMQDGGRRGSGPRVREWESRRDWLVVVVDFEIVVERQGGKAGEGKSDMIPMFDSYSLPRTTLAFVFLRMLDLLRDLIPGLATSPCLSCHRSVIS
jgi:hypothetical protein